MLILIVEDSPTQATLIARHLRSLPDHLEPKVEMRESLAECLEFIKSNPCEIILLDLNLPDSVGIETYEKLREADSRIPVVIMTSAEDEALAMRAIKTGAQDYLFKSQLNPDLVTRALLFAIERQRQWTSLMDEMDQLREIAADSFPAVDEGLRSGSESEQASFASLADEYRALLEHVSQDGNNPADRIAKMAKDLKAVNGGPGDLIEMHYAAILDKASDSSKVEFRAAAERGRLLLIQVLGLMAIH